jgi:hypothetical protein
VDNESTNWKRIYEGSEEVVRKKESNRTKKYEIDKEKNKKGEGTRRKM